MKYLQDLYNKVIDKKVSSTTFLKEARRNFSHIISPSQPFEEVAKVLARKGYLKEYLSRDYVSQHEFHIGFDIEKEKCADPVKAEETVLRNITKDRNYYTNAISKASMKPVSSYEEGAEGKESPKSVKFLSETLIKKPKSLQLIENQLFSEDVNEAAIFEDNQFNYNQPDYEFYCVLNGKIFSGWSYKEDAIDCKNEYVHKPIKVYSKKFLTSKGIDVNDNKFWGSDADLAEIKTNLFEDLHPFQEEQEQQSQLAPEHNQIATDIKNAVDNNKEFKGLYDTAYTFAEQRNPKWRVYMQDLAKNLYGYLASVKTYVDDVAHGDMSPIVNILTKLTSLNESKRISKLPRLVDILK